MSDVDEDAVPGVGEAPSGEHGKSQKPRQFKFPSHQSHMVSLAKMCRDNKQFQDCVIQCDDGFRLKAHKLVLGAASSFLKMVFQQVPSSLSEATIVVPGVKESVVSALLDFLYTGEMTVVRSDTADLQLLIETLQIDPSLISVDTLQKDSEDEEEIEGKKRRGEVVASTSTATPRVSSEDSPAAEAVSKAKKRPREEGQEGEPDFDSGGSPSESKKGKVIREEEDSV